MVREQQKWKLVVIIFVLIISGTSITRNIPKGECSTEVLTYTIKKARIIAEIINGFETTNYQFDNTSFPENTDVILTTTIGGGAATVELAKDDALRVDYYTTDWFKLILPRLVEETYLFAHSLYSWPDIRGSKDGYVLEMFPYLEPVASTWQFFEDFGDSMVNAFNQYKNQGYEVDFEYYFIDDRNNYYFECWCGGEINGEYGAVSVSGQKTSANVTYDNLYKMVIDKNSGIVQGARVKGRIKGVLNDDWINIQEDYQYELKRYNLPRFKLGPNFIVDPNIEQKIVIASSILIPLSMATIIGIILVIRKRKAKNIASN